MGLFGKKQKKPSGPGIINTDDEILGFIDELFRLRMPLSLQVKKKQWTCNLYFIDLKRKLLRVEEGAGLSENVNKPVMCGFSLDNTWFVFQSKLIYSEGKPHVEFPLAIKHHERRKHPRVSLTRRENVRVSILQSLGAGIGITGFVRDVNVNGICLSIERSIKLENEQEVNLHPDILPKGTELMIVKVKNMPGVPPIDTQAVVNRVSRIGGRSLAIYFPKLPGAIKVAIEKLVSSRYLPYRPVRRSYKKRQEIERRREESKLKREEEQKNHEVEVEEIPKKNEKKATIKFVTETITEEEVDMVMDEYEEEESKLPFLLSLGENLKQMLHFLEEVEEYEWIHVDSPMKILRYLRERKSGFLLLPPVYNQQSMLEYLEKISSMGVLESVEIILFSQEPIPPRDLIKCRILGIQHTLEIPLKSSDELLEIISQKDIDPS